MVRQRAGVDQQSRFSCFVQGALLRDRDPARSCETQIWKAMGSSAGCRRSYSCAPERLIPDQVAEYCSSG
jgi:hypothetical protein